MDNKQECGLFKCLYLLTDCTRCTGSDVTELGHSRKNFQYAIFVQPIPFSGNYFEIFCNCSQCLFRGTFHNNYTFYLLFFDVSDGIITKNKLLTPVYCMIQNLLISVPQTNGLSMTIYIRERKITLRSTFSN